MADNAAGQSAGTGHCTKCSCPGWRSDSGDPPECINVRIPTNQLCGHSEDDHK